jgi:hypothetical protein
MTTLREHLFALQTEKLKELYNAIIDAGIMHENRKNARAFFKKQREVSTGKLKKIYAALSKADDDGIERMFKVIAESDLKI